MPTGVPLRLAGRLLLGAWLLAGSPAALLAGVLHSRDEALELAFPQATSVRPLDFYLTPEQRAEIERLAAARVESSFLTVYTGERDGHNLGYALIDTHVVRTLPETLLVVISPEGEVTGVHLLAFYEPPEYAPPQGWFEKFRGWKVAETPGVHREVAAIAGATLSTRAANTAVRRALAIYRVLLKPR